MAGQHSRRMAHASSMRAQDGKRPLLPRLLSSLPFPSLLPNGGAPHTEPPASPEVEVFSEDDTRPIQVVSPAPDQALRTSNFFDDAHPADAGEPSLFGTPVRPVATVVFRPEPTVPERTRNWTSLGLPLAILSLGMLLGIIAVLVLVAAGLPAPWASPARPQAAVTKAPPPITIPKDGTHAVGPSLIPGRYQAEGGPNCRWTRLGVTAKGTYRPLTRGAGTRPTVMIQWSDAAFRTTACGRWTRS